MNEASTQPSKYDDHRLPLQKALKGGSLAIVAITVVSLIAWGAAKGMPGVWGVVIGALIGGGFVLLTAVSVLLTSNSDVATTGAVIFGGWLVKLILLIVVLVIIRHMEFYDHVAFFVTVVLALIAALSAEVWAIVSSKVTYIG